MVNETFPKFVKGDSTPHQLDMDHLDRQADEAAVEMLEAAMKVEKLEWDLQNARLDAAHRQRLFNRAKVAQLKEKLCRTRK